MLFRSVAGNLTQPNRNPHFQRHSIPNTFTPSRQLCRPIKGVSKRLIGQHPPAPMALPIPQPSYIFRGHQHPIHHTSFIRSNTRLITGDSEGYLVVWSLATRRAVASWRAHEGAILDVKEWGSKRLITCVLCIPPYICGRTLLG